MSNYIVLATSVYNFPNKETGEIVSGVKISYLDDECQNENGRTGFFPITINLPYEEKDNFKEIPAIYHLDFKQVANGKGMPILKLKKAEFVKKFEFPKL